MNVLILLFVSSPQLFGQEQGESSKSFTPLNVKIGGQFRARYGYQDPRGYTNNPQLSEDFDLLLLRTRINLMFPVKENLLVFIQPQDSRIAGQESEVASNDTNVGIHQAYLEYTKLFNAPFSLKIGRQELYYGDGRLVSPMDFDNVGRSWDGMKLQYQWKEWSTDVFWTTLREGFGAEDDQDFLGIYTSCSSIKDHVLDFYILRRRFADNTFTDELGRTGDLKDTTLGARVKGKFQSFDYAVELVSQTGDLVDTETKAHALAFNCGYDFKGTLNTYIGLEYTFATGDENPTDGKNETFDPLFIDGATYQGFANLYSWKNGHDFKVKTQVSPWEKWLFWIDFHLFRLDEKHDAWYNFLGSPIRRDATGMSNRNLGKEIDFITLYRPDKNVTLALGYAYFLPGEFVKDTGKHPTTNLLVVEISVMF